MNRFFHRTKRACALLLAVITLASFAVPASAFDDLSEVVNVTDYGTTEVPETPPSDISEAPEEEPDTNLSDSQQPDTGEEEKPSDPSPDAAEPPVKDTGEAPEPGQGEELPAEPDQALPNEPTVGMSGLDPPDGFSFEFVRDSGSGTGRRMARASSTSTMYMEKLPGLTHYFPFNSTTIYNAYKFYTADGQTAFCVEPARFNSTNGTVVTGSLSYSALSSKQQAEIAKAIAACGGHSNNERYFATQAIIWEIAMGQSPRSGSVYKAVITPNAGKLSSYYEEIRSEMESSGEIPSFMNPDPNDPAIHKMTDNGGSWSIDLTNTNSKVTLSASDFTSRASLNFSVSGNTLTVTSGSEPDNDSFVEWHGGGEGSGLIFWNSSQQTKASASPTQGIPADGYMAFSNDFIPPPPDIPETPKEDPALGYLTIVKYDGDTNLPLGGAIFKVECDGYINDAVDVPYGGKTIVIPIPEGQTQVDVTVTEVTAPSGYVMDSTPKTVTVTANETVNIVEVGFVNYPEACSLEIYKHETGNKGVALEGASFRIRYADPNVSAQTWTETTDGSGKIHIDLPAAGALIVEELSAPAGYVMNAKNTYDVTVMRGEQKVLDVPNDKRAQLIVVKKDAQSGQTLAGAIIKITLLRAHTPPYEQNISYTQTTGADGRTVFSDLIPGEYRVEEQSPPQYYLPTDVVHNVSVFEGNTEAVEVVFENEPWSGLTIKKVDSTNDKGLQGAVFKLYRGSHEDPLAFLGDFESNENGIVVVPKLQSGQYYTIVEAQPPYGYLLSENNVQTVMVRPDAVENNVTVIFQNKPKPKLLIEKIDEVTGKKLEGAVFRLSLKDSAEYKEFTTGADGTVLIENLEEDWYTVQEIRSPTNYILDDQIRNIQTKAGETTILRINNHRMPDLTIRKVDEQSGKGIPGVTLRATKEGAKEYQDVTTGLDGVFVLENVTPGWYIITEQRTPETHILDQTPHYIEVKADQDTEIVIKNKAKPSLRIIKTDSVTKQPMRGVTFEISVKQGATLGEYRTDANGEIFLPNIEPNLYVIRETKTLDGYLMDTQTKEALVEWGKTTEIEFTNTPKNPLLIYKVDFHTGEPLAGATFLVEKVNGEHVGEYITGRNGYATVTGIEPGFYVVKEVKPPLNYILDEAPKTVELKYDEPAIVQFEDKAMSGLHIKKIDSLTKEPMEGVSFRVSEKDGRTIGEFKTDAQGSILIENLQPGWYTIRETDTLEGYILDETPRDVEFVWGQLITVEFTNDRKAQLLVKKVDADTGEPLANAKFRIETVGGAKFKVVRANGEVIGEFTTNTAGFFMVTDIDLNHQSVTVYETQAAKGYIHDPTPQTIELVPNKTTVLQFANQPLMGLQIKKVDDVTGKPMAGVSFKLSELDGRTIGSYTTDDAGLIFVSNLTAGSWVVVEETKTLPGYRLDSTPRNVEIKGDKLNTLEYRNQPYPNLLIKKMDAETGRMLEGVKFKLFDKLNRELGTLTTNQLGQIHLTGMEAGTYYLRETEALPGYVLDSTVREISLYWGKTTTVELKNTPMGTLRVKKIDAITKKPIYGVTFNLYDMKNNLLGEYITNDAGIIEFPKEIQAGKYLLKEVKAAPNYVLDDIPKTIEVKSGETAEIIVENQPVMGKIQIVKKSAEYNDVSKLPAGSFLEGAVFEIFNSRNEVVDRITTDKRGIANSKDLPAGEVFGIREITAPDFYLINPQVLYAEVKKPDDLIRFEILDANEEISVSVQKYGNIEAMPGGIIRYDFEKIGNTSTVPLDNFYWRDTIPTDAVRIEKIYTGTWSEHLHYEVLYKTNKKGWRTLDTQYSNTADTLDCSREALRLGADEVITEIKFEFGTVQAGFHQVEAPYILCQVNGDLPNEYRFTNKTDVGGQRGDEWVIAKDQWTTIIYAKPRGKLPKTGF